MGFSFSDITDAFDCAEECGTVTRDQVVQHLLGECKCDRNRCAECGGRPRNKIPQHEPTCSMSFSKR